MTFDETQQEFANRTGLSVITIARYETNSRPKQRVLQKFAEMAREHHLHEYAQIFEGDETRTTGTKGHEFEAAHRLIQIELETTPPSRYRAVRAATAVLLGKDDKLEELEELFGSEVLKADNAIQYVASQYDLQRAAPKLGGRQEPERRTRKSQAGRVHSLSDHKRGKK